jgi:ubiquitin-protein ligase
MDNRQQQLTPDRSPTRSRRTGPTPSSLEREQAMRDYKLGIEYKHLKQHCPGGVYLVPSFDDLRQFHGVIFLRRGVFTNGIFKFTLTCPPKYNDMGTHPIVKFSSYVYNPHIHPESGEVDLCVAYPEWDPSKHFLVTALTYVKRIFYVKDYDALTKDESHLLPNQDALNFFQTDQAGYRRRVQECVKESQRSVFLNEPGCTINFNEEAKHHELLRNMLKERFGGENEDNEDDVSGVVTREGTLEIIEQVAKLVEK